MARVPDSSTKVPGSTTKVPASTRVVPGTVTSLPAGLPTPLYELVGSDGVLDAGAADAADAEAVQTWVPRIGSGNCIQNTGAAQPVSDRAATDLNGMDGVVAAIGDFMTRAGALVAGTSWTIVVVYSIRNSGISPASYACSWSMGGLFVCGTDGTIAQRPGLFDGTDTVRVPNAANAHDTPQITVARMVGTDAMVRTNGPTNSATGTLDAINLASLELFDRGGAGSFPLIGAMGLLQVYPVGLSDGDIVAIENSLEGPWGLTLV